MKPDVIVDPDDATIAEAAALIAAAYPVPSIEMNRDYLRWHLGVSPSRASFPPLVAICRDGAGMFGFAGATPRMIELDHGPVPAYVVSFVAVADSHRGRGVAASLYDALLPATRTNAPCIVTFAVDGTAGARAITAAYPRSGFSGHDLGEIPPWAALRGRTRVVDDHREIDTPPTIRLHPSPALHEWLDADPRGSADLENGARVVSARRVTATGFEPVLLLEHLPRPLDTASLSHAVTTAFDRFPDHGRQLVVPNFPEEASVAAAGVGLRRLAGPLYRAWIWSNTADAPLLRARRTNLPIV